MPVLLVTLTLTLLCYNFVVSQHLLIYRIWVLALMTTRVWILDPVLGRERNKNIVPAFTELECAGAKGGIGYFLHKYMHT